MLRLVTASDRLTLNLSAIACQHRTVTWAGAKPGKPLLSPGVRGWQQLSNHSCVNVSKRKSLTHSRRPIWLCLLNSGQVVAYLMKVQKVGKQRWCGCKRAHPLWQSTGGWETSCTVRISLFSSSSSLSSSSILAPAAFEEGANGKKRNKTGGLQSFLSFLWLCMREYFLVWEPLGAAAWGMDLMSLSECFRAWQKKKRRTFRACSVSNSLLHSGY